MPPLDPVKKCAFVLKVGEEQAVVDIQRGAQPIGGGIMSVFKAIGGFLELKLHGDAGDLELWLYSVSYTHLTLPTIRLV